MSKKKADFSRRGFLRTAGVVGLGSMLSPFESLASAQGLTDAKEPKQIVVPTRSFGKTGVKVSILALGVASFSTSSHILLKQGLKLGVSYWDTAYQYSGGQSERSIGKFFKKYPEDRKKVFLITKSTSSDPKTINTHLEKSLKRMNTSYIDLFFIHGVHNVARQLTPNVEAWVEKAKTEEKIRFFGFSTHKNMEDSLLAAAKLGWIDGIMLSYNFRVMHTDKMEKAVDECTKAGIGLTAMKTQASGWLGRNDRVTPNEKEQNLFNKLKQKGLTIEQAKLKAVWDDNRIASICSYMPNMSILMDNASAAMDKTKLSFKYKDLLDQYALETSSNYCAGCASICEAEINYEVPISDVMRYLMYNRCYGEHERAKSAFKGLPSKAHRLMKNIDYRESERKCPQKMQIGRLMQEAAIELA
jgi:predicted aldo/keto reductase-like oxidoreductase